MKKILIIIDMQNDFITGSLANEDAQKIVKPICKYVEKFDGDYIYLTRDTHGTDYLKTPEGKKLSIEHCIKNTEGWKINSDIEKEISISNKPHVIINKPTFGSLEWLKRKDLKRAEILICGTCTDICVVSNALIIKAAYPQANVKVLGKLCAGLTKEKHKAALETMKSCQIEVI